MVSPLQIVQPGEVRRRVARTPQFPIAGTMKPFGLYPLWAHPVLPGETLKTSETKYRILSMPVKHPLAGAWCETWLCYVSLTDIDEALAQMFISDDVATTGFTASSDRPRFFTKSGQIDYLKLAVDRIATAFFRDEEEPGALAGTRVRDGVPVAGRQNWDWAQNLAFLPDDVVEADLPSAMPESGTLTPLELMRASGMSEMTYEKYLAQYGVIERQAQKAARIPEILRYTRDWTVPVNTVEATTGRPSSAWAWSATVKAEKAKRFDEPGFLVMLACVRPKMFDPTLAASMIGNLWGFSDFFPVYNLNDPAAGLKGISANDPVFGTMTGTETSERLWYDHRDLLTHGEAFVNDWNGPYALPQITSRTITDTSTYVDMRSRYPTDDDVNDLFVESDEETPQDARMRLYYEGIGSCTIAGHIADTTR